MKRKKNNVRDKPVLIALSQTEHDRVRRAAESDRISRKKDGSPNLSKYCRNIVLNELDIGTDHHMDALMERFLYEIRKIGVNINQAVKRMNQGMGSERDIKLLRQKMDELLELHREILEHLTEEGRKQSNGGHKADAYERSQKRQDL